MKTEQQIEALLFFRAEPVSVSELSKILNTAEDEVNTALASLESSLENRGVRLVKKDGHVEIRTSPEATELIENMIKADRVKDLGKAGLETLAIVLYRSPVSRRDIDHIRGVNSSFILRNLLIRGLIERVPHQDDKRIFAYRPTFDLLGHLGISKLSELPEYDKIEAEIEAFKAEVEKEENDFENAPTKETD